MGRTRVPSRSLRLAVSLLAASAVSLVGPGEAAAWKVAHWNMLHGWGRYWGTWPVYPARSPFSAISNTGGSPDGSPCTADGLNCEPSGTTNCSDPDYPATWNDSSQPIQELLATNVANDSEVIALTLSEARYCLNGITVKSALAAANSSWASAGVHKYDTGPARGDTIIARHGFVTPPSTALWPANSAGDIRQVVCDSETKYHIIHAHVYTDAAHTASKAVHLFATRWKGTACVDSDQLEATQADEFIRAKTGATGRILVMGDFNMRQGQTAYNAFVGKGYTDSTTDASGGPTYGFEGDGNPDLTVRIDLAFYDNLPAPTSYQKFNTSIPSGQTAAVSDHVAIKVGFEASGSDCNTTVVLDANDPFTQDTFIWGGTHQNTNFNDEVNYPYVATRADETDEYRRKALLKFDTDNHVPLGATICSAKLYLTLKFTNSETRTLSVYDIRQSFQEAEATWNQRQTGVAWSTPGGTLGSARNTFTVGTTVGTTYEIDVTSWVQTVVNDQQADGSRYTRLAIVDPATTGSSENYKEFYSTENTSVGVSQRPRLVVTYR